MVNSKKKSSGFTLIELLLATSLLMLVLFAGYYGYSLYMQKWQKRTQFFWQQSQQTLAFDVLSRVFESTFPYIVNSDNNEPAQYFSGDENRIIFITNSPLFSRDTAVVEFKILQKDEHYSLIYNEASMNDSLLLKQSDTIAWKQQVVLMENLQSVSFEYYGWKSLSDVLSNYAKDESDDSSLVLVKPELYKKHIMEERRVLPISINIRMKAEGGERSEFPVTLPEQAYSILVDYLKVEA